MKSLALAAVASLLPAIALAQTAPREVFIPSGGETLAARVLDGVGEGPRPVPFTALEFDGGHNPSDAQAAARSFIDRRCFPG